MNLEKSIIILSKNNLKDVRQAKSILKEKFGKNTWLKGIGISGETNNYHIIVNVDELTNEIIKTIPKTINDIQVVIQPVGNIKALKD